MNKPTPSDLLSVCIAAARRTGHHALEHIARREECLEHFDHDIKLVLDRECQTVAETYIQSRFPDHTILGEEGVVRGAQEFEWIIDPIDGTANYTRGLPGWCCSVAVRRNQNVLAGCVYVPLVDECFTATSDGPAELNGAPIHCAPPTTLPDATFFGGFAKDVDPRAVALFGDLAPRVNKLRLIGCAAIDLCHVACGRSDGYYEPGLYIWDFAAAGLIAQRAGAQQSLWPREEAHYCRYLCSTPSIHAPLRALIERHYPA